MTAAILNDPRRNGEPQLSSIRMGRANRSRAVKLRTILLVVCVGWPCQSPAVCRCRRATRQVVLLFDEQVEFPGLSIARSTGGYGQKIRLAAARFSKSGFRLKGSDDERRNRAHGSAVCVPGTHATTRP